MINTQNIIHKRRKRVTNLRQKNQGSSRYTFFVRYRWLWCPRTTATNWFAVMICTLSRLEHGWFRKNSVCCGPVYGPWLSLRFRCGAVYNSRLSLRVSFGPVCTQHLSSQNCDISLAFNFRHAFIATYKLFYISTSTVSPAAASCADCTSWSLVVCDACTIGCRPLRSYALVAYLRLFSGL